ncbi:F-box domain-containing protein [Mycena chlorophos]|uniref:F-box domain-containing protein n=1 Tax=Mycena chlorophos TaxID=658473 RepID=A0A8H6SAC7_MYCCL|nr:F-box domain-containing protein [Mycena chlorophos]
MSGQKFSALTLTSLPSELLTEIFAGTSRRTLLRVCFVSKLCHAVAIPLLYREVTVGDWNLEALEALVEAFRPRRGLGLHVRSFSVGMSELSLRRALSAITNWEEALPRLEALSIWSLPPEQHAGLLFIRKNLHGRSHQPRSIVAVVAVVGGRDL